MLPPMEGDLADPEPPAWPRGPGDGLTDKELLPLVRAGVRFKDGVRVERNDDQVPVLTKNRLSVNKEKRGVVAA